MPDFYMALHSALHSEFMLLCSEKRRSGLVVFDFQRYCMDCMGKHYQSREKIVIRGRAIVVCVKIAIELYSVVRAVDVGIPAPFGSQCHHPCPRRLRPLPGSATPVHGQDKLDAVAYLARLADFLQPDTILSGG